jgi:putative NADPH-quinone reductase
MIDGHPDGGRLSHALLDRYAAALPSDARVTRIAVRDLRFDPNMRHGYTEDQPWEPDLKHLADIIAEADHLVFAFPMWWGAEPAMLKGLIDRLFLPGHAFRYREGKTSWDKLYTGRSADVVITMDTPPWFLRLGYGDAIAKRWTRQILGFVGMAPVRIFRFGPTWRGGAAASFAKWSAKLERAATSIRLQR